MRKCRRRAGANCTVVWSSAVRRYARQKREIKCRARIGRGLGRPCGAGLAWRVFFSRQATGWRRRACTPWPRVPPRRASRLSRTTASIRVCPCRRACMTCRPSWSRRSFGAWAIPVTSGRPRSPGVRLPTRLGSVFLASRCDGAAGTPRGCWRRGRLAALCAPPWPRRRSRSVPGCSDTRPRAVASTACATCVESSRYASVLFAPFLFAPVALAPFFSCAALFLFVCHGGSVVC